MQSITYSHNRCSVQWQYIIMEDLLKQYGSIEELFEVSVAVRLRNGACIL